MREKSFKELYPLTPGNWEFEGGKGIHGLSPNAGPLKRNFLGGPSEKSFRPKIKDPPKLIKSP